MKKIVHQIAFCLILLPMFMFTSCCLHDCEENEEVRPTYNMTQELKDYTFFPVGSWWVYKDSITGAEDSIILFYQKVDVVKNPQTSFNYEGFGEHLKSSFYKDTLFAGGGAFYVSRNEPCTYSIYSIEFFSNKEVGYLVDEIPNGKVKYIEYYDTLRVNGIDFKQVKVFKNYISNTPRESKIIFYARGVGAVKKVLYDGTVWELNKYHINQ